MVTLGKATEHLGGACGQSDRVGEEDFTTSQEKCSLEEDIAAREKVTLNCWGPLDFMARYCVGHFPEISCPFLLPSPPILVGDAGPTQLKADCEVGGAAPK